MCLRLSLTSFVCCTSRDTTTSGSVAVGTVSFNIDASISHGVSLNIVEANIIQTT